jgi:hypothetical protein
MSGVAAAGLDLAVRLTGAATILAYLALALR